MTLEITQAAREAAAECCPKGLYELCGCYGSGVSGYSGFPCSDCGGSGGLPPDWLVQAFQRAMNQAADEALERAAKVADEWPEFSDTPLVIPARLPDDEDDIGWPEQHGFTRSFAKPKEIATAIRALKGQQP